LGQKIARHETPAGWRVDMSNQRQNARRPGLLPASELLEPLTTD
jgi:hypothetical protein